MTRNLVTAAVLAAAVVLWMAAGQWSGGEAQGARGPVAASADPQASALNRVRVEVIAAEPRTRHVVLRGKTASKRMVEVKAEIAGGVVSRPAERGMRVAEGDLLCELAVDDRAVAVREARADLETARIELKGSLELQKQGLLSDVAVASAQARRESALANLHRQELNLQRTRIVAPFDGVVENLPMNVGDYAVPGATCATLIDLDPMLVRADVTENEVESLEPGQAVTGSSAVGREIAGTVSFVGAQSDPATRTYPVEITVDNRDYSIRSGMTVTMRIAVERVPAHQVASSLLGLDDAGAMGVRTLDADNRVVFSPVDILEDGAQGVWVTGLPDTVLLITVGQQYVALGETVEPVFADEPQDQFAGL